MAFDFLGTIPSFEHFEELEEFVLIEAEKIEYRIEHFTIERKRHLEILDKVMKADLQLRSEYKKSYRPDRLWLTKPRARPVPRVRTLDSANAEDVAILKKAFLDTIKFKRERNEYKIRRLRDLVDQINDEIKSLKKIQESYNTHLNKIKVRFDLDSFPENQRNKEQDQAEIQPGMTAVPVDKGIIEENGTKYFLVTSINPMFGTIAFDGQNPPIKEGDKILLSNGLNNGIKTVFRIWSDKAVVVNEHLIEENNSKTKVEIIS